MRALHVAIGAVFVVGLGLIGLGLTRSHQAHRAGHSRGELLELQSECADQAELQIQREGKSRSRSNQAFTYADHYSARLSECFLVTRQRDLSPNSRDNRLYDIRVLSDPFEGRDFAQFKATAIGPAWVVRQCVLAPRAGRPQKCHSAEEWERLVGSFMN